MTSNVIAPGPIAGTEGIERLSRKEDAEANKKSVPLGRWGKVKEIADATVFLFGDAGNFVNGQVLVVDGGSWRTRSVASLLQHVASLQVEANSRSHCSGVGTTGAFAYPDFLLGGAKVEGVKGTKKGSKL